VIKLKAFNLQHGSKLERKFELCWLASTGPKLEKEYRFHPERKWRFDFAHLESWTAIELEGGVWSHGAHSRGKGFTEDCEKYNAAQALGWRVYRYTTDMITTKTVGELVALILTREYYDVGRRRRPQVVRDIRKGISLAVSAQAGAGTDLANRTGHNV
jgi:hypothetical protein